ncbi:zinc ribbon domain-containing protein [Aureivirga marina]|uniref:hypothetical protein n=1 Tax=Aureivirga marina TaxID=1182451 RepID=UPI0018C96D86|nr:hypothetical protein [Aureivirga marina]
MLIIFGARAVHLHTELKENLTCPSCESKGFIEINIYRKHAHVFWIPLFPFFKSGYAQCQKCNYDFDLDDGGLPDPYEIEYDNVRANAKGPKWQFAGLTLILGLIAYANYASSETEALEKLYIESPEIGDIYEYKPELEDGYSTMKVVNVKKDSVFVNLNLYITNKISGIYEIEKSENYSNDIYSFSKEEIEFMHEENQIIAIERN